MTMTQALTSSKARFNIEGVLHRVCYDDKPLQVGDAVIDSDDGLWGRVADIKGNFAAVSEGGVVEVGVPVHRLVKLVKA